MLIKQSPKSFIVDEIYDLEQLKQEKGESGNYSYFILKKTNLTTQQALISIASRLKIPSKRFHYCGIKDKVAITTQLISLQNSNEEFAQIVLKSIEGSEDIELEYLGQFNNRLNLSNNLGNRFTIKIDDLSEEEIEMIKNKKSEFKVLNCFQSQRFGICQNTHIIGLLLIQNNIKDALFEVLRSLPSKYLHEFEEYLELIQKIHIDYDELSIEELSNNFKQILEILPNFLNGYKSCIKHLIHHPKDVSGAFRTIPKKIRTLYVHAFQSAIFNELLIQNQGEILSVEHLYLVGYDLDEKDLMYNEMIEILNRLGLNLEKLKLQHMPELSLEKTQKEIFSIVKNFSSTQVEESSIQVSFDLGKGAYATQVIDEILVLNNIIHF